MRNVLPCVGLVLSLILTLRLEGADFQGAESILKQLSEQRAEAAAAQPPADAVAQLRQKLADFQKESAELNPNDAAQQWLALFDALATLPPDSLSRASAEQLDFGKLLQALPSANAWDALAQAIEERAQKGKAVGDRALRLLAATLRNDPGMRTAALAAMKKAMENGNMQSWQQRNLEQQLEQFSEWFTMQTGSQKERLALFEKKLTEWERDEASNPQLDVPDLAKLAGRDAAVVLARRILLDGGDFYVSDESARKLLAEQALQNVPKLKSPPWKLIRTVDDAALYEALATQFPKTDPKYASDREQAEPVYLLALIAQNRTKDAARFIVERRDKILKNGSLLNSAIVAEWARNGLIRPIIEVFRELLTSDPALPFWSDFIELSARLGEPLRPLALLREVAVRPDLSPEARQATAAHYTDALFAANQIDEGLTVLREIVKRGPGGGEGNEAARLKQIKAQYEKLSVRLSPELLAQITRRAAGSADSGLTEYSRHCLRLARLGRLLNKPEIVREGIEGGRAALAKSSSEDSERSQAVQSLAGDLARNGAGAEAEAIVAEELLRISKPKGSPDRYQDERDAGQFLELLATIYHLSERPADVLRLFDEAPKWPAQDLGQMTDHSLLEVPLLFAAAKALAATGRKEDSRRVVKRLIETKSGYDPAYRLLLDLGGENIEAWLDSVRQRDRFEERPLIWKARLQLDAGRLDDAEKSMRAAIAIDPSDGEQGKGDRMRAYAILGEILEKKGDADQAKIMRGAVAAIRLSEDADDWWEAGLLTRAVQMYEEALGHFADAYCIQSRLALRYSELGDFASAEKHYRRAYELMPESFGRIESHCFGCEGAFRGDLAQGIAERVFTQLAEKSPDKPQVFYLLGYLREQQDREAEAVAEYRKAVKLDPDYLNAWAKLFQLHDNAALAPEEVDAAIFAMLRLDPGMQHHSAGFQEVRDLRALWEAVLAAEKMLPPPATGPLYPLAAAKAERTRKIEALQAAGGRGFDPEAMMELRALNDGLRASFVQQTLLQKVGYLISTMVTAE